MTHQEVINIKIRNSANEGLYARVYFKTFKNPVFGLFIILDDHEELGKKGFTRFVASNRVSDFEIARVGFKDAATKLMLLSDIKEIKLFDPSTVI